MTAQLIGPDGTAARARGGRPARPRARTRSPYSAFDAEGTWHWNVTGDRRPEARVDDRPHLPVRRDAARRSACRSSARGTGLRRVHALAPGSVRAAHRDAERRARVATCRRSACRRARSPSPGTGRLPHGTRALRRQLRRAGLLDELGRHVRPLGAVSFRRSWLESRRVTSWLAQLRRARRVRPDGGRRGVSGGERARHAVRRRARLGRAPHELDVFGSHTTGFRAYLAVVLAGRARLPGRRARRLGDRRLRRQAVRSSGTAAGSTSTPARLERAERWFDALGATGPCCSGGSRRSSARSSRSRPGVFEMPFARYNVLTLRRQRDLVPRPRRDRLGARLELGHASTSDFRYVEYAVVVRNPRRRGVLGPATAPLGYDWPAMPIPHVDVKAQYAPLIPELKAAFERTLESGRFIFGPEVEGVRARGGRVSRRRRSRSASRTAPTRSCSCSTRSGSAPATR